MTQNNEALRNVFGTYKLQRFPVSKHQPLRAWDAADEYLLNHLNENELLKPESKLLIINDQFGALATCLHKYNVQSWSDSYLNSRATLHNFVLNQIDHNINLVPSTQQPEGVFDIVLIKIPKTKALLEDQLIRLKPHINKSSRIIAAAMTHNLHTSTLKLFESILGSTKTSLAVKKARLVFTNYDKTQTLLESPYPTEFHVKHLGIYLSNHANVFSRDKLDIGSLLMLEQFKKLPSKAKQIVDLGCGNGVLGIIAQRLFPESQLSFVDESYMAVASAQLNYEKLFKQTENAQFITSDCLSQLPDGKVDLILCNPLFHQQHTVGDQIAWQMFTQSHKRLAKGGKLWIVGNRHLHYSAKLKKIFSNCKVIAANKKFQIISARKI